MTYYDLSLLTEPRKWVPLTIRKAFPKVLDKYEQFQQPCDLTPKGKGWLLSGVLVCVSSSCQ